jgi:general secretion pathway protein B
MSFILDALKKSESDRQRQSGPALFEVRVAPPRTRLPLWAFAIAALLVINLGIVMWMLMHRSQDSAAAAPATAPAPTPTVASAPQPVPAPAVAPAAVPGNTGAAAPAASASAAAPANVPAAAPLAPSATQAREATNTPAEAAGDSGTQNPADYAPAEDAHPGNLGSHVRRGTAAGVPLYQDAASVPGMNLPELRLDFHMYAAQPQDRFVMINMHKLHEGDTSPEGARVESITPDGAVMSFNGSRFLLPRD